MADKFGYKKGARGIDGQDGQGFETQNVDRGACKAMYGRCWDFGTGADKGDITGETGMGHAGKRAQLDLTSRAKSAVGGERKLGKRKAH